MGEWRRAVPHGEASAQVVLACFFGGFLFVVVLLVLSAPDRVTSWPGIGLAVVFLGGLTTFMWRSARAGVHIGPRGVLLYRTSRRSEVVP